jgi:hypothetical protein
VEPSVIHGDQHCTFWIRRQWHIFEHCRHSEKPPTDVSGVQGSGDRPSLLIHGRRNCIHFIYKQHAAELFQAAGGAGSMPVPADSLFALIPAVFFRGNCYRHRLHHDLANILRRQYRLPVIIETPRGFLAQNDDRYDIIQLENWGSSMPGAAALNQDHLFTLEAFGEYWDHLTTTGVVIISRRLLLPPSDSLRLWSTAYEALQKNDVERPGEHLALLRNFDTFTLLVSKSIVNIRRVIEYCRQNNFDPVFL